MRHFLLSLVMMLTAVSSTATVKLSPMPARVVQSDGTVLTVIGRGDEHSHYFITTDGMLLCHRGNDFFVARVEADGRLTATTQLAHEAALRTAEERRLANLQQRQRFYNTRRQSPRKAPLVDEYNAGRPLIAPLGKPRIPVILAEFSDVKFIDDDPIPVFHQYFNYDKIDTEIGNGTARRNFGSVAKYYRDMSFGLFDPQFEVVAKVTLDESLHYYGQDSKNHVDSLFRKRFLPDVCQKAFEQGVDFSQYDSDNDGYAELVYIVFAGYAQSWAGNSTDCIWPKTGLSESGPYGTTKVLHYSVNSELNAYPGAFSDGKRINGVGLACHEFAHCLGLPDIYPTDSEARNAGNQAMEYWDLMDAGEYVQNGYYPTELTCWERETLGWMQIETLSESGHYELPPISDKSRKAFRIPNDADPTGCEYLLLQTIKDTLWNRRQQGHGMMVMHVDFQPEVFALDSNAVNNEMGHSRFTYIPADGEYISQYLVDEVNITTEQYRANHWGDPYPGEQNVTAIEGFDMYTGRMDKQIANITEAADGTIAFDLTVPPIPTAITESFANDAFTHPSDTQPAIFTLSGTRWPNGKHLPPGLYLVGHKGSMHKMRIP